MNVFIFDGSIANSGRKKVIDKYNVVNEPSQAHIALCRFSNRLGSVQLKEFTRLLCIVTFTTGTDHIDTAYCKCKGIHIICLFDDRRRLERIRASSEFALISCMMAARGVSYWVNTGREPTKFMDRSFYQHKEVCESIFGIVGLGRIGRYVAENLTTISKSVVAYDPFIAETSGVQMVQRLADLKSCDVVLVSCTYSRETESLVTSSSFFDHILDGPISLVNVARGPIVNARDLRQALLSNIHLTYYCDTMDSYSDRDRILLDVSSFEVGRICVTPHIAGSALSAIEKADELGLQLLEKWLNGRDYC